MTDEITPLDLAHAAMGDAPDDDALRLKFFERLVESELFLLLEEGDDADDPDYAAPRLFETPEGAFMLAFDREYRLAEFAGAGAPYAALSGRSLMAELAGQGVSLGLNLDVAPSAMLLPPEAVDWLAETLANRPAEAEARITAIAPPKGLPPELLPALDTKLATAMGLAQAAFLVAATYESGARNHLLAFVGTLPGAETALAQAVSEALTFTGLDAAALDVIFPAADSPLIPALTRRGLRFDLPQPVAAAPRTAPGTDPDRPPKLR
jgi:hypothetical protein